MRVFFKGKQVPIEDVTWKMLCHASTYVNYKQDIEVRFPPQVKIERLKSIEKLMKSLKIKK